MHSLPHIGLVLLTTVAGCSAGTAQEESGPAPDASTPAAGDGGRSITDAATPGAADGAKRPDAVLPDAPPASLRSLQVRQDFSIGESRKVRLQTGTSVMVKLLAVEETQHPNFKGVIRTARVKVSVDGTEAWLPVGLRNLPTTVGPAQIDCEVTGGYRERVGDDRWHLTKDARLRLWAAGSPLTQPGTFVFPLKQRWVAAETWEDNEPILVSDVGGSGNNIYYHVPADLGGAEGLTEVLAAAEGKVSVSGGDKIEIYDGQRGWFLQYNHIKQRDVSEGDKVKLGQRIGLLGKEGASGGWAHLHFVIWENGNEQTGFPYLFEAYMRGPNGLPVVATAGPLHHELIRSGGTLTLDGTQSWSASGEALRHEWTFSDGTPPASQATVTRRYDRPGCYTEVLKVTDPQNRVAYDFVQVSVFDRAPLFPPSLSANFHPTLDLHPGTDITFKVRTWGTKDGEESWRFGDGTTGTTRSNGVTDGSDATALAPDGYVEIHHKYDRAGDFIVRVERTSGSGLKGDTLLWVHVD